MKLKINLQQKIVLIVIGLSAIVYGIAIGYISTNTKRISKNDAVAVTIATAQKYASNIRTLLEEDLAAVKVLSKSVLVYKQMPEEQWKRVFAKMYEEVIKDNPQFIAIWDSWELSHIDPNHTKPYGRYVAEFWRDGSQIKSNFSLKSMTGDNPDYARIKRGAIDCIENPYFYSYTGNDIDQLLMTSLISPVIESGKYIGVVGVDISLDRFHPIINQIKPFEGSYAFLVANDLQYVAHPDIEKHGETLLSDYEETLNRYSSTSKITNGEEFYFEAVDINGTKSFFVFTPVIIGRTHTPWSLAIVVPQSTILSKATRSYTISIISGIIGLLILSTVIFFSSKRIINPILSITNVLKRMAKGNIAEDMKLSIEIGRASCRERV